MECSHLADRVNHFLCLNQVRLISNAQPGDDDDGDDSSSSDEDCGDDNADGPSKNNWSGRDGRTNRDSDADGYEPDPDEDDVGYEPDKDAPSDYAPTDSGNSAGSDETQVAEGPIFRRMRLEEIAPIHAGDVNVCAAVRRSDTGKKLPTKESVVQHRDLVGENVAPKRQEHLFMTALASQEFWDDQVVRHVNQNGTRLGPLKTSVNSTIEAMFQTLPTEGVRPKDDMSTWTVHDYTQWENFSDQVSWQHWLVMCAKPEWIKALESKVGPYADSRVHPQGTNGRIWLGNRRSL